MQPIAEKPTHQAAESELRETMRSDHEHLEQLFVDLLAAFQADARQEAARLWSAFDVGLRTHLQLEEQCIFPEFAKRHADETELLLREHAEIRRRLLELGVGVDLHITRDEQVEQFIRNLRAHAAREDALLYQWAERDLPGESRTRLGQWLKAKRRNEQHAGERR